jgi:hypothetical protein
MLLKEMASAALGDDCILINANDNIVNNGV